MAGFLLTLLSISTSAVKQSKENINASNMFTTQTYWKRSSLTVRYSNIKRVSIQTHLQLVYHIWFTIRCVFWFYNMKVNSVCFISTDYYNSSKIITVLAFQRILQAASLLPPEEPIVFEHFQLTDKTHKPKGIESRVKRRCAQLVYELLRILLYTYFSIIRSAWNH